MYNIGGPEVLLLLIVALIWIVPIVGVVMLSPIKTKDPIPDSEADKGVGSLKSLTLSFAVLLGVSIGMLLSRRLSFPSFFASISYFLAAIFFCIQAVKFSSKVGRKRWAFLAASILGGVNLIALIIFYIRMRVIAKNVLS